MTVQVRVNAALKLHWCFCVTQYAITCEGKMFLLSSAEDSAIAKVMTSSARILKAGKQASGFSTANLMSCEAATQTELGPSPAPAPGSLTGTENGSVTLRQGCGKRKPRPNSLVDYQSYRDTKLLVARFLEQSSCSLTPEVQELVNSIKTVLRSDEEHMEEAVRCASFIDQAITVSEVSSAQSSLRRQTQMEHSSKTLPLRKSPGILHLRSCGDLSSFTWVQTSTRLRTHSRMASRAGSRLEQERPHSLIGVFRETVL